MEKEAEVNLENDKEIINKAIENLGEMNSDKTEEMNFSLDNRLFSILKTVTTIKSKEFKTLLCEVENNSNLGLYKFLNKEFLSNANKTISNLDKKFNYEIEYKNVLNARLVLISKDGNILSESNYINFSKNFPDNIINLDNFNSKHKGINKESFIMLMKTCFFNILKLESYFNSEFCNNCSSLSKKIQQVEGNIFL